MIEIRTFVGGMDKDSSFYDVVKGFYLDALNITKDAISENNDLAATNVIGNRKVEYSYPTGRGKAIGSFGFQLRNTVIFFRWNANGYHGIYEGNITTRVITKIFVNLTDSDGVDVLGFTEHGKINSINIYPRDEGDLLFFLDSLGRPTGLDIALFKAGTYTPVTRAILDKGKMPPLEPPQVVYDNDTTRRVNNTRNKLFRFKYRWIYDDFEKSTFSPISIVPLPVSILSDTYTNVVTNNNVIRLVANTGGKNVAKIEIAMSYVEKSNDWSDFQSVEVIDKATAGLDDDIDFDFSFFNDSTYPDIDIQESIELFDYVPDIANAQEMPNGNVIVYVGITEGYDKDTVEDATITVGTVAAGNGGSFGSLNAVITIEVKFLETRVVSTFSGIPAAGTIVNFKLKIKSTGVIVTAGTYTTNPSDTSLNVAGALNAALDLSPYITDSAIRGGGFAVATSFLTSTYEFVSLEIIPPSTAASTNSIATWPWSTERNIGRLYFDQKGKTNGILYTDKVTFPAYAENGSQQPLIPYINYKINDIPPSWAYSMQFAFTKDGTQWIVWQSLSLNKSESAYIYLDVTSFVTNATKKPTTAQVLSYTFQDGDRLRFWRDTANVVYADTYDSAIEGLVVDPVINSVATTGRFLKIKNVAPFTALNDTLNYVINIYRPSQQLANKDNQVYYELGRQYAILDPTLSTRRHSGQVTDQIIGVQPAEFNFYEGDAYFRARTLAISNVGYSTFNVMDRNFVDFYISAVSSIDGRPNIIDLNARRQYYGTLARHSQAYQANTNINGLNRFYPNNFDEYDLNYGDVTRVKARDKYLKVFQTFKIGVVPLYSQLTKDPNGDSVRVVTDKLLNPIEYRVGNFGLSAPESLASWHFADYGCDVNKGIVWRDSNDGVYPISDLYKMSSWAAIELPLRTGNFKIYGTMNPKHNQYIMSLEAFAVPVPYLNMEASSLVNTHFSITSTVSFTIDWGDGTTDTYTAGVRTPTHVYTSPYTGSIKLYTDDFSAITIFVAYADETDSLSIATSEIGKLSALEAFSMQDNVFLGGVVSDLPSTLTSIGVIDTNLSGNVSELARSLISISILGVNTLTGVTEDLPPDITSLNLLGNNTLSGDIANLPRTLTVYVIVLGDNTLTGDVADLPSSGIVDIEGNNSIYGALADFPSSLIQIKIEGVNTISGNIVDIQALVDRFVISGQNTITGNIANIPVGVSVFQLFGYNTVSGNLANIPALIYYFNVVSLSSNINTYSSGVKTWAASMDFVNIISGGVIVTAGVDNILIELAAQATTWFQEKKVNILGAAQPRSAASNAAVATLVSRGVTVTTNP